MESAESVIPEYVDEEEPSVRPGWHVSNLQDADWALMRLAHLQRQIQENAALEEAAMARIQERTARLNKSLANGVAFFSRELETWADLNRTALLGDGKRKSRKLLHGSIGWRKAGGGFKVADPAALLEWAVATRPELVKREVRWAELKGALKETGELPPGVDVEPERETFKIDAVAMGVNNGDE